MDTYLKLNTTSVKNTRTDYEDVQEPVAFFFKYIFGYWAVGNR